MNQHDIGLFIASKRREQNLTQEQLAEMLGIGPANISYIENGKFAPSMENFEKMVEIASLLCVGFSHVRVDLYNINGKIYFGEMTFTNGSGYERIVPDEYDFKLGELWNIDLSNK